MKLKLKSALLVPHFLQILKNKIHFVLGKTCTEFIIQNNKKTEIHLGKKGNDKVRQCIIVFIPVTAKGSRTHEDEQYFSKHPRNRGERKQHLSCSLICIDSRIETQLLRDITWEMIT